MKIEIEIDDFSQELIKGNIYDNNGLESRLMFLINHAAHTDGNTEINIYRDSLSPTGMMFNVMSDRPMSGLIRQEPDGNFYMHT
jgi:hypothetical protein